MHVIFVFSFQKIAIMAHKHGALVLVDNSILSPVLSQPLDLGAGIKILPNFNVKNHSLTKKLKLMDEDIFNIISSNIPAHL